MAFSFYLCPPGRQSSVDVTENISMPIQTITVSVVILPAAVGASGQSSPLVNGSELSSVLMQQSYPDLSYCRVPRDIRSMVESGRPTIVFEAGTVLRSVTVILLFLCYIVVPSCLHLTINRQQTSNVSCRWCHHLLVTSTLPVPSSLRLLLMPEGVRQWLQGAWVSDGPSYWL